MKKTIYKIKNPNNLFVGGTRPDVRWVPENKAHIFDNVQDLLKYLMQKVDGATTSFIANSTFEGCKVVEYQILEIEKFDITTFIWGENSQEDQNGFTN